MSSAWTTIAEKSHTRYAVLQDSFNKLRQEQNALLQSLLQRNTDTEFGRTYNFAALTQSSTLAESFQQHIPIQCYDSIEPLIQQQMSGVNALVSDEVLFYEPTGGSSGGAKYVPYTEHALQLLQSAVEPWLYDLIKQRPALADGPAYWSVSPAISRTEVSEDGTPIGASSDLVFMRAQLQQAFAETLPDMSAVQAANSYEQWQRTTLLTLIMHDNLRLFSVWSPTFLTALLRAIPQHSDWLLNALLDPSAHGLDNHDLLSSEARNTAAINRLNQALSVWADTPALTTATLWPQLDCFSCWTHGPAKGAFEELQRWFPSVHFQAKGLIATEGVITIPFQHCRYPVLAVNSGFFEFVDECGAVFLPEHLKMNKCYRVLITNASGLYRYDIGDMVRLRGYHQQAPMLEFIGRCNLTSDLVGEKLTESFVSQCLESLQGTHMLAPAGNHYCLYVEDSKLCNNKTTQQVDNSLCRNPQYAYARQLGQLGAVAICHIPHLTTEHLQWQKEKGQRLGDIKPTALCTDAGLIAQLNQLRQ